MRVRHVPGKRSRICRYGRRRVPTAGGRPRQWPVSGNPALPVAVREQLQHLSPQLQPRRSARPGYGPRRARGRRLLFVGPSSAQSHLAGRLIARELGTTLWLIRGAEWAGGLIDETQRQLDLIFRRAAGSGGVLLFDEVDALYAGRSEPGCARDRCADVAVAYLLTLAEDYPGTVILSAARPWQFADRVRRRLQLVVDFTGS